MEDERELVENDAEFVARKGLRAVPDVPAETEEKDSRRRAWLRDRCNVPAAYLHATKGSWDESRSPWPEPVDTWTGEGDKSILTLVGEPGRGKTHVAVALLTEWTRNPELRDRLAVKKHTGGAFAWVIMIRVPQAVRALRLYYETKDEDPKRIRGKLVPDFFADVAENFDLVIYDDWGSQTNRENWWEQVEGWVDDRHANQQPTIITMNRLQAKGASSRVSRRIVDGLVVDMPWRADR